MTTYGAFPATPVGYNTSGIVTPGAYATPAYVQSYAPPIAAPLATTPARSIAVSNVGPGVAVGNSGVPVTPVRPVGAPTVVTQSKLATQAAKRPPFPSAIPNEAPPIGVRKMMYNGYGVLPPVGSGIMSTPEELAMAQFGQSTFNTMYTSQVPVPAPMYTSTVVREPAVVIRTSERAPVVRTSVRAAPPVVVREAPVVVTPPPVVQKQETVVVQPQETVMVPVPRRHSVGATTLGGGNPYGLAALNRGSSGYNAINNAAARNVGRLDPKTSLPALNLGDIDGFTANQVIAYDPITRPVQGASLYNSTIGQPGFPAGPVYAPGANPRGFNSVSSFVAGTQGVPVRPY